MRILIILVLLSGLAAVLDFCKGKIPNVLILTGCSYGLFRIIYHQEVLKFVPGILFPLIILFPLYKIGVLGAGDIKLFSMIGFYVTPMETISCIFFAFVLGAVFSIISFVRYKNFAERITYLFSYLRESFLTKHFQYYYSHVNPNNHIEEYKTKIHMAIPIFISVLFHAGGIW